MTATRASAPGKIILFGEHAVVYGQPALAVPVAQVQATATVTPHPLHPPPRLRHPSPLSHKQERSDCGGERGEGPGVGGEGIWIDARNIGRRYRLEAARPDDPLALAIRLTLDRCGTHPAQHAFTITVDSTIPIASGLGSGAAVCTAVVRAIANYLNRPLPPSEISALVFETEKLLHGTPSGIDNTVVAYGRPVYFVKGRPPEPFTVAEPFHLLIADTGLPSPTRLTVGDVRAAWQADPDRYEALFRAVGEIVRAARDAIGRGDRPIASALGQLMNRNHALLQEIGVSCAELDALVEAARRAGALGAKLSGGGRGGNMLALVTPETSSRVEAALLTAQAKRVISTVVGDQ